MNKMKWPSVSWESQRTSNSTRHMHNTIIHPPDLNCESETERKNKKKTENVRLARSLYRTFITQGKTCIKLGDTHRCTRRFRIRNSRTSPSHHHFALYSAKHIQTERHHWWETSFFVSKHRLHDFLVNSKNWRKQCYLNWLHGSLKNFTL